MSRHRVSRQTSLRLALVAVGVSLVVTFGPSATPAAAAEDDLRLSADATYRVIPSESEVRVRIDWEATNLQPNSIRRTSTGSVTTRYFYNQIYFSVPPEARSISATSGDSRLSTTVRDLKGASASTTLAASPEPEGARPEVPSTPS
jgi:hypothetical protein